MAGRSDMEINCAVRQVLVRHRIDLGSVSFSTRQGTIWLSGEVRCFCNFGELDDNHVLALLTELRNIPDVPGVRLNLSNWLIDDQGRGHLLKRGHPARKSEWTVVPSPASVSGLANPNSR